MAQKQARRPRVKQETQKQTHSYGHLNFDKSIKNISFTLNKKPNQNG